MSLILAAIFICALFNLASSMSWWLNDMLRKEFARQRAAILAWQSLKADLDCATKERDEAQQTANQFENDIEYAKERLDAIWSLIDSGDTRDACYEIERLCDDLDGVNRAPAEIAA